MKAFVAVVALCVIASVGLADDKDKLAIQLELQKAKNKRAITASETQPISYDQAITVSKKTGKPIFVSVGFNCAGVCGKLRPDVITVHEDKLDGDATPRAMLIVPSKSESSGYFRLVWKRLPGADEVKAELAKYKPAASKGSVEVLIESLIATTIAMPDGDFFVEADCPGGVCANVAGMASATITNGAIAAGQRLQEFRANLGARFPRLQAIRGRFRGRLRAAIFGPDQAEATSPATVAVVEANAAAPLVVSALGHRHLESARALHRALGMLERSGKLTEAQVVEVGKLKSSPEAFAAFHSRFKAEYAPTEGAIGKLGDGRLLKLLLDNLPQILAAVEEILKMLHLA